VFIIIILFTLLILFAFILRPAHPCPWTAVVQAWIDEDEDGIWDASELPLAEVAIRADDPDGDYKDMGLSSVTDWTGESEVIVLTTHCERARFEVYPDVPAGMRLTSSEQVLSLAEGETAYFGFNYLEGVASPTPYQARLTCQLFPHNHISALEVDSRGVVWAVTWNGVLEINPAKQSTNLHPLVQLQNTTPSSVFDRVIETESGTIWVVTGAGRARYDGSEWVEYNESNNLITSSVPNIGTASDGTLWFYDGARAASYQPETRVFHYYGSTWLDDIDLLFQIAHYGTNWLWTIYPNDPEYVDSLVPSGSEWEVVESRLIDPQEATIIDVYGWVDYVDFGPDGMLWLASSKVITRLNPADNSYLHYDLADSGNPYVASTGPLTAAPDGSVWIATSYVHNVLVRLATDDDGFPTWETFDARDGVPDEPAINDIAIGPQGEIWLSFDYENYARCEIKDSQ
jgi:hypothetical protein